MCTNVKGTLYETREPLYLYSNSAVIAWWLQSTSAQNSVLAVKKGKTLINILHVKVLIANYCHLYFPLRICLTKCTGLSDSRYSVHTGKCIRRFGGTGTLKTGSGRYWC